jgi:hypothetical protein
VEVLGTGHRITRQEFIGGRISHPISRSTTLDLGVRQVSRRLGG